MNRKKFLVAAFIMLAFAQLFVPIKMISKQAYFTKTGNEFRFKVMTSHSKSFRKGNTSASIQGRYIWLMFEDDRILNTNQPDTNFGKPYFVEFATDSCGFAKIRSVHRSKPQNTEDWVQVTAYTTYEDTSYLQLNYPFNKYYIRDFIDKKVEARLSEKLNNSGSVISLKVKIKSNQYIISDLLIDSLSFNDFVNKIQNEPKD